MLLEELEKNIHLCQKDKIGQILFFGWFVRTHWNSSNLTPVDPVSVGLCSQLDLDKAVQKAYKRIEKRKAEDQDEAIVTGISEPDDFKVEENKNTSLESDIKQAAQEAALLKNIEKKENPEKEYTSDNVFAKLNELKESE